MSEEDSNLNLAGNLSPDGSLGNAADQEIPVAEDFDQNGMLLKIAVNGITVQDYVKRLQESDILVAVDGKIYRDGPAKLREIFESKAGTEAKWLLSFWRDGQIFDINGHQWKWRAGDQIKMNPWTAIHYTKNVSDIPRPLIKITGARY